MALTIERDTVYGLAGQSCHGGCGHVFISGESFGYIRNSTNEYVAWCRTCLATLGAWAS